MLSKQKEWQRNGEKNRLVPGPVRGGVKKK